MVVITFRHVYFASWLITNLPLPFCFYLFCVLVFMSDLFCSNYAANVVSRAVAYKRAEEVSRQESRRGGSSLFPSFPALIRRRPDPCHPTPRNALSLHFCLQYILPRLVCLLSRFNSQHC